MKLVETHALSVTLHGGGISHVALSGVNLCLCVGQHTALLGPNGAGKSTLLKVLQGSQWPDQTAANSAAPVIWYPPPPEKGEASPLFLHDEASPLLLHDEASPLLLHDEASPLFLCDEASPPPLRGETSPLVGRAMSALVSAAQHEQYVRHAWDIHGAELLLTAFDDSPLLYTLPQPKQEQAVQAMARTLRLEHLLARRITTLSQGQMRLLLLTRAVLRQPALLLLDECLDGLDAQSRHTVLRLLDEVRHSSTIILTAHRQQSLPPWLHNTLYMQEGRVYSQSPALPHGPTAANAPCEPQPRGPYSPVPTSPASFTKGAGDTAGTGGQPPLVTLRHANIYVERALVLHDINWTIRRGEHWLLRGANGSGKSTLLRLLAGDEYPALGGSIERHLPRSVGHNGSIDELEQIRRGVRIVSDALQAGYDYDLTAQELVLSGFDGSIGLYRNCSPAEYREALYWMRRVGMDALTQRTLRSLSTGQARRLFIARALVGHPDILLLDEPCSGLDSQARVAILAMLGSLAADNIHTVLVSHHGEDRLNCTNREATLVEGRLSIDR